MISSFIFSKLAITPGPMKLSFIFNINDEKSFNIMLINPDCVHYHFFNEFYGRNVYTSAIKNVTCPVNRP